MPAREGGEEEEGEEGKDDGDDAGGIVSQCEVLDGFGRYWRKRIKLT